MTINQYEVYTAEEAQKLLKISTSTMMRMLKKGAIPAAKVGRQYRILGKEILKLVSPPHEAEAIAAPKAAGQSLGAVP